MQTIEQFLEAKNIQITAMRLLVYRFLADQSVAVTLSDMGQAFSKVERTTLFRTVKTFKEK